MILYNTTFHLDSAIESDFLAWLQNEFIPVATRSGMTDPLLCRLSDHIEPGCAAFALHLYAPSADEVDRWRSGAQGRLMTDMATKWRERALAFSTQMEVISL